MSTQKAYLPLSCLFQVPIRNVAASSASCTNPAVHNSALTFEALKTELEKGSN